ncbi:MAG: hypothetical protein IPI46_14825 [Bacteroidetes bacterium]|nr:hypothetical protein [Bacteroidota bacterium]
MAIKVAGYQLSLRKDEADSILGRYYLAL